MGKKRVLLILAGSFLFLSFAALSFFFIPLFSESAEADAVIRIPHKADAQMVEDSIAKYLGRSFAKKVKRTASLRKSDFSSRHGAYLIPKGSSPFKAERKLSQGAQHPLTITINGFRSLNNLSSRLSKRLDLNENDLADFVCDPDVLTRYGLSPQQALSLFVDDSYEVYWSASPTDIVEKIGRNYLNIWNDSRREKAKALGLTPAEIMTICSIVDEETNKADEKGIIGRLYINRIHKGMALQADPTIRYALNDFTIRRVKGDHLKVQSPFNTYINKGLPPGPIRTTSKATIDAVLNSEPSDYLYMCARDDFSGYHNFASDYHTHLENARRYQKALNLRNIH